MYCDKSSTFEESLDIECSDTIHKRNSWQLKCLKLQKLAHCFLWNTSKNQQNLYNLRNTTEFNTPLVKKVHNGLESLSYLNPRYGRCCQLNIKKLNPCWSLIPKFRAGIRIVIIADFAKITFVMLDMFQF